MVRSLLLFVFCAPVVLCHYGDPYKHGCEKDEQEVQITGIAGKICTPPCNSDGTCPTDVPTGVTAKPSCVLQDQSGDKYCALVCTSTPFEKKVAAGQCGTNASCKKATSNSICTYDDAPPPPSSPHWKPVNSPTFSALSEALNVAFTKDGKTGYVGAGTNGVGPQILKSTDSGVTWAQVWPDNTTKVKFDLLLASAVKNADEAVITGALFQLYSTNGEKFQASVTEVLDPSQDAKVIPAPSNQFAIAVNGEKVNGVATSMTGEIWTPHNLPSTVNASIYPARYGAYPTATTWYLNAGSFPTHNSNYNKNKLNFAGQQEPKLRHLTHKLAVDTTTHTTHLNLDYQVSDEDGFSAGIFKTTDAGKSWKQVFNDVSNTIYPNGIDCFSADHCISVVEGTECQILVTRDGGAHWNATLKDTDSSCSLTYVAMLSETEAWVGGGHLSAFDFEGRFFHTTDGGATWTKEAIKGLYIFDLDMTSPTSGYSVALTASSGVNLLKYDPTGK